MLCIHVEVGFLQKVWLKTNIYVGRCVAIYNRLAHMATKLIWNERQSTMILALIGLICSLGCFVTPLCVSGLLVTDITCAIVCVSEMEGRMGACSLGTIIGITENNRPRLGSHSSGFEGNPPPESLRHNSDTCSKRLAVKLHFSDISNLLPRWQRVQRINLYKTSFFFYLRAS